MKLEVQTYPHPVLAEIAKPVEKIDDELNELIDAMIKTMYEDDGIGLAAPQVNKSIRLIVVDHTGPEKREALKVIVNPEIIKTEGKTQIVEGCLSVPGFTVKVPRAEKVTVKGMDREGNDIEIEADEMLAIVLQHEIDHLDGKIILDYAGKLKRKMYDKKVSKHMRRMIKAAKQHEEMLNS
ncbi:MAG: peptide deformylase [Desulfovibrio sp.]